MWIYWDPLAVPGTVLIWTTDTINPVLFLSLFLSQTWYMSLRKTSMSLLHCFYAPQPWWGIKTRGDPSAFKLEDSDKGKVQYSLLISHGVIRCWSTVPSIFSTLGHVTLILWQLCRFILILSDWPQLKVIWTSAIKIEENYANMLLCV